MGWPFIWVLMKKKLSIRCQRASEKVVLREWEFIITAKQDMAFVCLQ